MSKKSRAKRAQERKKAKRSRKAQNQAKYEAWRDAGQNKKSKRTVLKKKRTQTLRLVSHRLGPCGNAGCKRCEPINLAQWRAKLALREQEKRKAA